MVSSVFDNGGYVGYTETYPYLPLIKGGLIMHLDAGDRASYAGSGTSWYDLTRNNNGVLVGAPTYNSANGGYFTFNGTSQEVTTTATFPNINGTSFTFFGWFRSSVASGRKIIGFQSNQSGVEYVSYDKHVYLSTTGNLVFAVYNGTANAATSAKVVSDGTWHSFAAVYNDSGACRLYVDGVQEATVAAISTDVYTGYLRIAGYALIGWPNADNGYFTGDISTIMHYNRVLSPTEIQYAHNSFRGRFFV